VMQESLCFMVYTVVPKTLLDMHV